MDRKTLLGWLEEVTAPGREPNGDGPVTKKREDDPYTSPSSFIATPPNRLETLTEARGDEPETAARLDEPETRVREDD